MSLIMDIIILEQSKLTALELEKLLLLTFFYTVICKYRPISTKLGKNMYDQQTSNKCDYESSWTGTTRVICPSNRKKICI